MFVPAIFAVARYEILVMFITVLGMADAWFI
jgi:hypothetical protein